MDSVVATVSGYHGSERFKLIKLISQSGASYVGAMNPSTTHLVCRKFEGKKYELARKFKIIVVNHRWIEDCIKQGRRVSERPYIKHCGFEVGPLLLEAPVVANEVRSVFGEVPTTSNISKKPVINIEDGESGDDDWKDSWLLKENMLPDVRQNKIRSNRLKRKCTKRQNNDCSESSKGNHRLILKNICNDLKSCSDSEENSQHTETHHNVVDIGEPSNSSGRQKSRRLFRKSFQDHEKRPLILEDLEKIEDLGTCCNLQDPDSNTRNPVNNSSEVNNDKSNGRKLSTTPHQLSCVICWTDFSSTRGVLTCGHRFCFSCIQNWADHMASMKKVSTCPLCKANFYSIQKMEDALSSDQKIYSQTVPNENASMDVYILPHAEASTFHTLGSIPSTPVCYQCGCVEPEELLVRCDSCQIRCVHSYCLDPPQFPWVCIHCKDLRMRYFR
ncbi:unnamed protein product [Lactuca saligna]|uniref:RING-type E3 ubiquitin transferase BRCA1 n=1 Tax=Lactuca saligna TaxID=75948 RepID=A0AA35VT81_LACSI|nr:unnamed protein product [Lactuca saligna]